MSPRAKSRKRPASPPLVIPRPASSLGLLTRQQVADELTISPSSVDAMVRGGWLKAIRPVPGGRTVRFLRADVEAAVAKLRGGA